MSSMRACSASAWSSPSPRARWRRRAGTTRDCSAIYWPGEERRSAVPRSRRSPTPPKSHRNREMAEAAAAVPRRWRRSRKAAKRNPRPRDKPPRSFRARTRWPTRAAARVRRLPFGRHSQALWWRDGRHFARGFGQLYRYRTFQGMEIGMARTGDAAASKQRMQYRGLRGWLEQVDKMGELRKVDGAHWDVEMGAITHMLTEKSRGNAPALLFDNVPGYPRGFRTLYGQLSSVRRIAL